MLLLGSEDFYHFVIDNQVLRFPAFDPPIWPLSKLASKHTGSCPNKARSKSHHGPLRCRLEEWNEWAVLLFNPSGGASSPLIPQPTGAVENRIASTGGNMAICPILRGTENWPWTCCSVLRHCLLHVQIVHMNNVELLLKFCLHVRVDFPNWQIYCILGTQPKESCVETEMVLFQQSIKAALGVSMPATQFHYNGF